MIRESWKVQPLRGIAERCLVRSGNERSSSQSLSLCRSSVVLRKELRMRLRHGRLSTAENLKFYLLFEDSDTA
jgi:hypothetical protein